MLSDKEIIEAIDKGRPDIPLREISNKLFSSISPVSEGELPFLVFIVEDLLEVLKKCLAESAHGKEAYYALRASLGTHMEAYNISNEADRVRMVGDMIRQSMEDKK